jgi:hypothetical protein
MKSVRISDYGLRTNNMPLFADKGMLLDNKVRLFFSAFPFNRSIHHIRRIERLNKKACREVLIFALPRRMPATLL